MARTRVSRGKAPTVVPAAATDQWITEKLPQLVESLINLAVGVRVDKETPDGNPIYTQPPNRLAAEYLINRVLGKPTERMLPGGVNAAHIEIDRELKDLRNLTTDELIQLHRKTIGEG